MSAADVLEVGQEWRQITHKDKVVVTGLTMDGWVRFDDGYHNMVQLTTSVENFLQYFERVS